VRLIKGSRYLEIKAGKFTTNRLYEVYPIEAKKLNDTQDDTSTQGQQAPYEFMGRENCNEFAQANTGKYISSSTASDEGEKVMVPLLEKHDPSRKWGDELKQKKFDYAKKGDKQSGKDLADFFDDLNLAFRALVDQAKNDKHIAKDLKKANLNEALKPVVGAAIVTLALSTAQEQKDSDNQGRTPFLYHWGTIVAGSGSDYITLENYARREKGGSQSSDPLYFFRLHGPVLNASSWHDRSKASGDFPGGMITFLVT